MGNPGQQLKKLRLYFNMTQLEFAEAVSVKRNNISMIESGRNKPTFDLISDICGVFNLTADYFLSDDNPESFEEYFANINTKRKDILNVTTDKKAILNSSKEGVDVSANDLNNMLTQLANSSLLYLEFHLSDILLNLKLLQESLTKHSFDRKEFEKSHNTIMLIAKKMKADLKNKEISTKDLINGLLTLDEGIRVYLDSIRDLSKELYLHNSHL